MKKWHGVTWDCIDWEKKTVEINKAYTRIKQKKYINGVIVTVGSKPGFKKLKSPKSYRTLNLSNTMMEILKKHKEEQKELAKKNNKVLKETDWVFTTSAYTGMLHDYIGDRFRKVKEETKITNYKELTPHCLRHTFCSAGIEAGVNVEEMKELMGHGSISVTADIYMHLNKKIVETASKKISDNIEQYMKT